MLPRLVALLVGAAVCFAGSASAVAVETVTAETLPKFLAAHKGQPVFLDLYAPWCGHCKRLAPEFERLPALASTVAFAKMDATVQANAAAADRLGKWSGYPTLWLLPSGQANGPIEYTGDYSTAESIAGWLSGGAARFREQASGKAVLRRPAQLQQCPRPL
ncbi:hypothetical protein FNF27_05423 [Cafeteria roenbergensis]|uniref:Thioredoxin domain-containing protein n=2 Tax=Cafeteria roenbergensis TaxID=33653 RepID=A0A5A8DLH9_CAFRO|nr:hypothetical protein FNF29_05963 [Cafeteria roenbergensis]KAA0166088.1 hypothetical protein FNF28_03256 [Cafeteria roenbergensis]KAA0167145.1 hypothetical protein FNF31_01031 [Cafeteria roenbergensis]KAA0173074.1 hypothetical protein FNF27_05423 [Cafeteria roenbergensis]|eukprot:KAA0149410.1 hypothetical protein FNF29_05963 [Cafeteria roenbergensis]